MIDTQIHGLTVSVPHIISLYDKRTLQDARRQEVAIQTVQWKLRSQAAAELRRGDTRRKDELGVRFTFQQGYV